MNGPYCIAILTALVSADPASACMAVPTTAISEDGRARAGAESLVDAVHGARDQKMAWIRRHVSPAGLQNRSEDDWLTLLHSIAAYAPDAALTGVVKTGRWLDVQFTVDGGRRSRQISLRPDSDQPELFSDIFAVTWALRYPKPAGGWPTRGPELEMILRDRLGFAGRHDDFSGTALVVRGGQTVLLESYGFADALVGRRNTADTPFMLASAAKMFTTVAIAQLIENGSLTLDTSIGEVLPDYPNVQARSATVRQLLTHSAGMGGFFNRVGATSAGFERASEGLPLFAGAPLQFAPGTAAGYSNEGFIVLGAIVEARSGQTFYAYVSEHIFDRVGMSATGYASSRAPHPEIATGRAFEDEDLFGLGRRRTIARTVPERGYSGGPAGGAFSTASDMSAFMTALIDGRLLKRATLETLLAATPVAEDGHTAGFQVKRFKDRTVFGHNGGSTAGVEVNVFAVLETGDHYVLLGNQAPPVGQSISDDLAAILAAAN